jgi:hypothetical protein
MCVRLNLSILLILGLIWIPVAGATESVPQANHPSFQPSKTYIDTPSADPMAQVLRMLAPSAEDFKALAPGRGGPEQVPFQSRLMQQLQFESVLKHLLQGDLHPAEPTLPRRPARQHAPWP